MSGTYLLAICDPHFSDRKPASRKDRDFLETQLAKIEAVRKLTEGVRWPADATEKTPVAGLLIAGDLFHHPRGKSVSHSLTRLLIQKLREFPCPVFAIAGNHDMEYNRISDLETHPFGILVASGTIQTIHWPEYAVIQGPTKDSPKVLLLGKEYTSEGPGNWFKVLSVTKEISRLKKETGATKALALTHCFWGPQEGEYQGSDPVVGHNVVKGTGVDIVVSGHPHRDGGIVCVHDEDGPHYISEPGAMIRGTLGSVDINREPKVSLCCFHSSGVHEVLNVKLPHQPYEEVFDLAEHRRVKEATVREERFVSELKKMSSEVVSVEDILSNLRSQGTTPQKVLDMTQKLLLRAEAELPSIERELVECPQ